MLFCRGISTPTDKAGLPQALSKATRRFALPLAYEPLLDDRPRSDRTDHTHRESLFGRSEVKRDQGVFFIVWAMSFVHGALA